MGITEIKPCPFCGKQPKFNTSIKPTIRCFTPGHLDNYIMTLVTYLRCEDCECIKQSFVDVHFPIDTKTLLDELNTLSKQVIEQWNTRKE